MGSLGSRLRDLRIERNMSQAQLGARVGVGGTHVSNIEADRTPPSYQVLVRLAEELGTSLDWLALGREHIQVLTGKSYRRTVLDRRLEGLSEADLEVLDVVAKALGERIK